MPILGYWLAEHQGMGVAGLLFAIVWSSVLSGVILLLRWGALARAKTLPVITEN
jgi:Na+-driven multidrug efflux pump